jgi:hypothetical protein
VDLRCVRENDRPLLDGQLWCGPRAILPGPGINRAEQDAMGLEHIIVGERLDLGEDCKGLIETGREGRVFRALDDREVFLFIEIAQIAFGLEIAEGIEGHGLASRRYCT